MRRYLIFVTTTLSIFMYAIDATVVSVAFPSFTSELWTNVLWSSWTISIFFLAVTITMPLAGSLVDGFGRKKVFLGSLLLFTGSSLACGLAPTIHTLIAFRFLQGIGGACFLPAASGIVMDSFPKSRELVIGLISSTFSVGAVIGPNLGGWIVSWYSWRYIFFINVPIGIALIVSTLLLLKESATFSRPRLDLTGVALLSGSLLFLMLGLNLVGESFSMSSVPLLALLVLASLGLAALFFRQEKRAPFPVLDITLLGSRPFLAANVVNLMIGIVLIGVFSFIPLYATSVHGLSTFMSGVILSPRSLGMAIASTITALLLKKWGYRWPMVIGFACVALTTALLAPGFLGSFRARWSILETLTFMLVVNGVAGGMVFPAANNACIELMPDKVGTIVGLRQTFRNIGGALGACLLTFIVHVSSDAASGFTIAFISFGLAFLAAVPFLFLMPAGGKAWREPGS